MQYNNYDIMERRIQEIDYLKCVFIILMIIFHLVYIGDKYPYIKSVVYTFHMSGFLIISGFLVNINKSIGSFLRMILWIFIPYAIMETGYVVMASILPVREHISILTPSVIIKKIFISPIGPYWYFHTLIVCSMVWFILNKLHMFNNMVRIILFGLICFVLSFHLGLLSFHNAIYFIAGVIIRQSHISFITVFQPCKLSLIPLVILCGFPSNLSRGSLGGLAITYLSISFLLSIYPYIPLRIKSLSGFIGRNTLVILLFSPIFTLLSKNIVQFFSFDSSGILFSLITITFTISGCFGIAWVMDKMNVTRFFLGKKRILV